MRRKTYFSRPAIIWITLMVMIVSHACKENSEHEGKTNDPKLPSKEIVETLNSIHDYEDAAVYYQDVLPKMKKDKSKATKSYWLGRLHLTFIEKLEKHTQQFCQQSLFYDQEQHENLSAMRTLLEGEIKSLAMEKEQKQEQEKRLQELSSLLDQYAYTFALPHQFEQEVYDKRFNASTWTQKQDAIEHILAMPYLKENERITKILHGLQEDLRSWESAKAAFDELINENSAVKVINFDCSKFTNSAYYSACEQWRYDTYVQKFLKSAKSKDPKDFEVASFVRNQLDCYEISNAPDSKILAGKELNNKDGSFYYDCRLFQRMFEE